MTRQEFYALLEENNIDCIVVSFDDDVRDGYGIRKNYFKWETFFRERGCEYDVLGFPSESDALLHLLHELLLKNRTEDES